MLSNLLFLNVFRLSDHIPLNRNVIEPELKHLRLAALSLQQSDISDPVCYLLGQVFIRLM